MKNEYEPTPIEKHAVNLLKCYADENQVLPRSTSDLSPLERWLIMQLLFLINEIQKIEE
jgi:hypothetical protein